MKVCESCHNKDSNVTGCERRHLKHNGPYICSKCDICGREEWLKACCYYDILDKANEATTK